jgi:hypothetical protein
VLPNSLSSCTAGGRITVPEGNPRPYVGPRPFKRDDAGIFFGREREIGELEACIVAHGEVLFYAQSGAGKTSLINARLIPDLENAHFDVMAGARVKPTAAPPDSSKVANIYVFNALTSLSPSVDLGAIMGLTLREFLEKRPARIDDDGSRLPRLMIFDQFEELFTTHADHWQHRRGFFEQLRDAMRADAGLRILLAMREDHVAEMEPYAPFLPEQLRTRFRLERLRKDPAMDAVTKPIKFAGCSFEEGVPSRLVSELLQVRYKSPEGKFESTEGEFVETVQLQVVCETLWDSLPAGQRIITHRQLSDLGDVDTVLLGFYEKSLAVAARTSNVTESALRAWFEHTLITPEGTRGTVYRGERDTGGIPNVAIDVLENQHIIRAEPRGGALWYELTHDRLIDPIRRSGRDWLIKGKLQALEIRAAAWMRTPSWDTSDAETLLSEAEWEEAHKLVESQEARTLAPTKTLLDFLEVSRNALDREDQILREAWSRFSYFDQSAIIQRRWLKRLRLATALLPLAVIFAVLFATWRVRFKEDYFWQNNFAYFVSLVGPIAVAALLASGALFGFRTRWTLLRGAAEAIKSEIFKYRARVSPYNRHDSSVPQLLAEAVRDVVTTLAQTEVGRGEIAQATAEISQARLRPLSGAEYLQQRVLDQIEFFQHRTRSLYARLRRSQISLYIVAGGATYLAAIKQDLVSAAANAALLALLVLDTKDQTEESLLQYNQTLAALLSIRAWWEALTAWEKAQPRNLELFVQRTEAALKMETAGWAQLYTPSLRTSPSEADSPAVSNTDSGPPSSAPESQLYTPSLRTSPSEADSPAVPNTDSGPPYSASENSG